MIPLKMMLIGFTLKLLGLGIVVVGLLVVAYYMMHWLRADKQLLDVGYGACLGPMRRIRLRYGPPS
jgi:hypothetical protein